VRLSLEDLQREAAAAGFRTEPLEKALRLLEVLEALRSHPFLKERIALKGGTALNLFIFDAPRLSVDIDLNYIGSADRVTMLEERPKIEQAVQAVCGRLGIRVRRVPGEHAGGKWRLSYDGAGGRSGTLELDMSFMFRIPLWPPELRDSRLSGALSVAQIPVLNVHELAVGKLAALFSRETPAGTSSMPIAFCGISVLIGRVSAWVLLSMEERPVEIGERSRLRILRRTPGILNSSLFPCSAPIWRPGERISTLGPRSSSRKAADSWPACFRSSHMRLSF
jgi:hypothetical protein